MAYLTKEEAQRCRAAIRVPIWGDMINAEFGPEIRGSLAVDDDNDKCIDALSSQQKLILMLAVAEAERHEKRMKAAPSKTVGEILEDR